MEIREEIEGYVLTLINEPEIDHSLNLFESGLLTSLDILDLLNFVEETFDITISDDDIGMEYWGTINAIVDLIEKLQKQE